MQLSRIQRHGMNSSLCPDTHYKRRASSGSFCKSSRALWMQVWWLLTRELLIFQPNLLQFASTSAMISVFHPTLKNRFHRDEASSTLAESSTHKHTAKCQCHYLNATNTRVICRHSSTQQSKIIPQCWNFSATYIHVNNVQACCEHPPAVQRCE